MVAGLRASAQPRHLADLAPASAPSSSMPHEPSSLLPSPAAAEGLPPALPLKQHASAVLAAAGLDMRGQGGAPAPAAEPQDDEGGSGGGGAGGPASAVTAGGGAGALQEANGAGQLQQRHSGPASAADGGTHPVAAPPAAVPPPSPGAAAAAELEAILGRLMQIDKEGWFRHPVSELVAPKYYKIIKQPMCFEVGAADAGCSARSTRGRPPRLGNNLLLRWLSLGCPTAACVLQREPCSWPGTAPATVAVGATAGAVHPLSPADLRVRVAPPAHSQVMRGKIHGRQYLTWQELARDFELICSNALKYNQKRSHVYKQVRWLGRRQCRLDAGPRLRSCFPPVCAAARLDGPPTCALGLLLPHWIGARARGRRMCAAPSQRRHSGFSSPLVLVRLPQALTLSRVGKKVLAEVELHGRRAMAALVAAGAVDVAPASLQLTPADSQAVPSSLFRAGRRGSPHVKPCKAVHSTDLGGTLQCVPGAAPSALVIAVSAGLAGLAAYPCCSFAHLFSSRCQPAACMLAPEPFPAPAAADGPAVAGGTSAGPALPRSLSTADTATTEGAEFEPLEVDGAAWPAEDEADPAGYSSFEATDVEEDAAEEVAARQQAAALLDAAARDAVLAQPWAWLAGDSAASPDAEQQQQAGQQQAQTQPLQGVQQAAAAAVPAAAGHSREWKAARRGVEWRVRWLEHRLTELHHQRLHYEQQLAAEAEREAARPQAAQQPAAAAGAQQQEQQEQEGAAAGAATAVAGESAAAAAQQAEVKTEDGTAPPAAAEPPAAAGPPAAAVPPPPRLWQHRPRRELAECQLPGLLQHPFVSAHSVLGARQHAAAGGGCAASGGEQPPAATDSEDFPAEVHAALELLDQKLGSLRRQLVAMQRPGTQAALHSLQAVRVPGYRGGGSGRRGGGWTPRSGGATPRGTPRSGLLYRESSLGKRRRVPVRCHPTMHCTLGELHNAHGIRITAGSQCTLGALVQTPSALVGGCCSVAQPFHCCWSLQEYDVGEVLTPLGAPKFVERAQVRHRHHQALHDACVGAQRCCLPQHSHVVPSPGCPARCGFRCLCACRRRLSLLAD